MSDTKLRDLERRWEETGSPDDEAAYLLERVRVGDLSRERLELAAYCGHEGARKVGASKETIRELLDDPKTAPVRLVAALSSLGPDYLVLGLLAAVSPASSALSPAESAALVAARTI